MRDTLNNLVSSPANPQYQSTLASAKEAFGTAAAKLREAITPSEFELIAEMGGREFFDPSIADIVNGSIEKNAMTPSVARDFVKELSSRREQFMETVQATHRGLAALDFRDAEADPGSADVAFLIPRTIFCNELGTFASELKFINSLVRNLSECAAGQPDSVVLQELSSSVPTAAIMASSAVVLTVAEVVTRFLSGWEKVEKIRKIREELKEIGATGAAVQELTEQIRTTVDEVIEESTTTVVQKYKGDQGRRNELSNALSHDVRRLFGQIERGLTVEFRAKPNPDEKDADRKKALEEISALGREMRFPRVTNEPLLLTNGEVAEGAIEITKTVTKTTVRKSTKKETRKGTEQDGEGSS